MSTAATVFDAFNARALLPSQVANSFVPPDAFDKLWRARHSVVVGPRGSGKTTLLKMLHPSAIAEWKHQSANEYRRQTRFVGVFVPFDRVWEARFQFHKQTERQSEVAHHLSRAALTAQLLRSLLHSMQARTRESTALHDSPLHCPLDSRTHDMLARGLANVWQLESRHVSLSGLRTELGTRLAEIGKVSIRVAREGGTAKTLPDFVDLPMVESVSAALDVWQDLYPDDDLKWCLCFDEMELAPVDLTRQLLMYMRSTDERLLFKFALSPWDEHGALFASHDTPQAAQDYDLITLWASNKRSPQQFCTELWRSLLASQGRVAAKPAAVLGRSIQALGTSERDSAYAAGSRRSKAFVELAKRDVSFAAYLRKQELDPLRLDATPAGSRDAQVRKIAPLVEARLFFLRQSAIDGQGRSRSRKRLTLYAGWENVCAISEGNPRWFIGMVSDMLALRRGPTMRVSQAEQASVIEQTAKRFLVSLSTFPTSVADPAHTGPRIEDVIESIGTYFHRRQMLDEFVSEPPGSFNPDSKAFRRTEQTLGRAINSGAMIVVDEGPYDARAVRSGNVRLRLTYLLAAHYRMIPRLARSVSLSAILKFEKEDADEQVALELPL